MDVPLQESGPTLLLTSLKNECGAKTQDMILAVLDNWESLHIKASQPRTTFMQLYRMAFDEAVELGGMGMNEVAKTYFLSRSSASLKPNGKSFS